MQKWALDVNEFHYNYGKVRMGSLYSFSSVLLDGSTLSSLSLHVWKVAANSAIDTQIQVLVVYVHTCMYVSERPIWNPLVSPSSKGSTISIQLYTLSSLGPKSWS